MAKAKSKRAASRSSRKRRGSSEDMTGAKAATVETRQVSAPLDVAPAEKILHHMKAIKGWKDKMTTLSGHLRNAYKAAKIDKVPKSIIDDLLGLERGDADAFRLEMESLAVGLKAVGAPFQLNVFDIMYSSDVEQAKAEAKQAAKAGRGPECRFAEGSEAHDAYMETYAFEQAGMVPGAENLSDEEKADALAASRKGATGSEALAH